MNERIKELAREAGYEIDAFGIIGHWDMPELRKFAELIVKECIHELDMCRFEIPRERWMDERNDGIDFCVDTIKKHFGVE